MQVTALLINNSDKQFSLKQKLYFRLWLRLGDTFSAVYLPQHGDLYSNSWLVTCNLRLVPAISYIINWKPKFLSANILQSKN